MLADFRKETRQLMYAYFGHHRCATMWTAAILRALTREIGVRIAQEDRYDQLPDGLKDTDFLIHLNATREITERIAPRGYRGFHVIRDPRDILVSSYFSDKYSHPVYRQEFAQFRDQLNTVEFDQGLRMELERRTAEFRAMATWNYDNPDIFETRYEVITVHPQEEWTRILSFLGIPMPTGVGGLVARGAITANRLLRRRGKSLRAGGIPPQFLKRVIEAQAFQKLAGRKKGEEDPKSHYRKGVAGDWVNYLVGSHKDEFKHKWGQLLIDLGYEKDLNW